MSLYAYQVMEKVIENGSFAKAAEVLNLTPSAVSHIITKLEDEVELQLLNRDRSGTTLTGNGELLWPYIQDLLRMDENLEQKTETFDKFACRMIQHEMSHLDGDLFVDHVAPIRRKIISKKLMSIAKGRVPARYSTIIK